MDAWFRKLVSFHYSNKRTYKSYILLMPDSLMKNRSVDVIKAFNSTSRYLDDLLNIDTPYFEGMVNQIYPPELQLNKANTSDTEAPFWIYICLFLTALFHPKFMINVMTLILIYTECHCQRNFIICSNLLNM